MRLKIIIDSLSEGQGQIGPSLDQPLSDHYCHSLLNMTPINTIVAAVCVLPGAGPFLMTKLLCLLIFSFNFV